jgi:hypothetical protein
MKEATIRIRINEESQRVAFLVERNTEENVNDILELVGVLDMIKEAQLKKIGELARVRQ